jgi:hypothetical protein
MTPSLASTDLSGFRHPLVAGGAEREGTRIGDPGTTGGDAPPATTTSAVADDAQWVAWPDPSAESAWPATALATDWDAAARLAAHHG